MTPEQLENWFTYHQPTEETAPKYAAIRDAETSVITSITQGVFECISLVHLHALINLETRRFAEVIDANCPDSADKTAAIRCVRLARNAFNEWAQERYGMASKKWDNPKTLFNMAEEELVKARWQACSAIACAAMETR